MYHHLRNIGSISRFLLLALIPGILSSACALAGQPHARLDPALAILSRAPASERAVLAHQLGGIAPLRQGRIGATLDYHGDPDDLRSSGIKVRSRLGSILTADVPVSQLDRLADIPGLKYAQAARRFDLTTDVSVPETRASNLRSGTPPNWIGYTGKGVIVGIVDTGVDVHHEDFKDASGFTRILYIWDQTTGTGGPNHPPPYVYGTEWTKAQIDAGQCTERDTSSHGTVVLGTAVGDGSATGYGWPAYRYIGMAPKADIVVVKTTMDSGDIIDGMSYVKSKADALGKPFVINLSIGTQFGAHDGTDPMEQAIDQISGPGAVVCTAAGNNGTTDPTKYIHAEWTIPGQNQSVSPALNVLSNRASLIWLDMWYEGGDSIDVTLTSPNGHSATRPTGGTTNGYISTPDGGILIENAPGGTNPYNDDNECVVAVQNATPGIWTLTAFGRSIPDGGHCDAWIGGGLSVYWSTYGNNAKSLTIPGTSNSVITVSGYMTKSWWHNPDGTLQGWSDTYGAYATGCGNGPTRDGRQKPDLATPVGMTAAAMSADGGTTPANVVEDGVHRVLGGTSISVPHMTGAVALLLQKDRSATAAEIKSFVTSTARTDAFTGTVPNYRWGYGKLDVQAAIALVPLFTTVSGARTQADSVLVKLHDQIVSAGLSQLSDRFYVEAADRSSGVQVRRTSGYQPAEGDQVTVVGTTGPWQGERAILGSSVSFISAGSAPGPVGMINRALGGSAFGDWVPGVTDGTGLNNVGLLVTTWGRITYTATDSFFLDDGSGLLGQGHEGVKVYCPSLVKPSPNQHFAVVTGISSVEFDGQVSRPLLRPRKQVDLVYHW